VGAVGAWMLGFFIVYLVVMAYIGYLGSKRTKTIADFAIASKKIGPLFVALSIVATAYSVALYMGYPGWAYAWGYSSFWYFAAMGFAVPLGFFLAMKRYRFTMGNALSLPDYLGNRYNSTFMRGLVALVTIALVAYIGSQLAGMAKLLNVYTKMGYSLGLIIITVVVAIYIFFGGTYGHIWTDAIQMLIMAAASVVVFISGFIVIGGGLGKLTEMLAAQGPEFIAAINPKSPIAYNTFVIIMSYIMACLLFVWPQIAKVAMSLEREEDIRKCFYYVILFNFLAVFIMFGGLYTRALGLKVENIDHALPVYLITYFPAPIAGLIALSIVSAGMSTADTQFVVISTSIANDLYRKCFHRAERWDESQIERKAMILARLVVLFVAGGCFVVLYLFPPWSVGLLIWIGLSALIGALTGPLLLGLYWRRGTAAGAITSCLSGLVMYVIIMWFKLIKSPFVVAVACSAVGVIIFIVVSLLTKPMSPEHLAQYFPEKTNKK
jgi:sodium/pantothenate symporter